MKFEQLTSIDNSLLLERVYTSILNILFVLAIVSVIGYIFSYWSNSFDVFSDNLYGPRVVNNIIYEHGHITDWLFSEMPNFFPDVFLTFIIGLFTRNVIANVTLFGLIQTLYLIMIIPMSLKLITRNSINFYMGTLSTLCVLLLSHQWSPPLKLELMGTVLYYSYHFGAFLTGVTSLCLLILTCRYKKIYLLLLFYFFTIISIASNLMAGFYFTIPLFFTALFCGLFKFISRKQSIQLASLLAITNLSGYLLYKFCPLLYFRPNRHFQAWDFQAFVKVMINFFQQSPAMAILWIVFLVFAPLSLIKNRNSEWVNFIILWIVLMTILMVPVFIFMDPSLHYEGYLGLRHLQPLILVPIFIGLPLLIYKHTHLCNLLLKKSVCAVCFSSLVLFASFNKPKMNFSNFWTYYPNQIACFDNYAEKLHLHAGLGNYWAATFLTVLDHSKVKVVSVWGNFTPHLWLTSPQIYKERNQYDFIIVRSPKFTFDKHQILQHFGQPTSTFSCPGYEYYVYQNGALKNPFLGPIEVPREFKPHF